MKFCFHNSLLHANEEFLYEWKVIVAKGLCSRVSLLTHLFEATFTWIRSCFPNGLQCWCHWQYFSQQKDFTISFQGWGFFWLVCCFCLKFQVWKGAKVWHIAFFTCGSLPHSSLTAKWISVEEMQLPQCCTRGKSGRAFRVSHFVQPVTLPSQLRHAEVRASCCSFHGLAKAKCNYQGATCFWPALSLKQKPESKDRRLPGYSSQNHEPFKAVWLLSRTGTRDHASGPGRVLELCCGHICYQCFNQRHHIKILVPLLTPVPNVPLCSAGPTSGAGRRGWHLETEDDNRGRSQPQQDTSLGHSWLTTFSLIIAASHCLIELTVATAILH